MCEDKYVREIIDHCWDIVYNSKYDQDIVNQFDFVNCADKLSELLILYNLALRKLPEGTDADLGDELYLIFSGQAEGELKEWYDDYSNR